MSLCSDFVYFSGCYVSRLLVVSQYFFFFLCSCFTFMSLRFGTSLQAFVVRVHHVVCCESLCPHYYLTFFCFAVIFHLLFSISLWHFFGFYFTCAFFCSCCCFVYLYCVGLHVSLWCFCFILELFCLFAVLLFSALNVIISLTAAPAVAAVTLWRWFNSFLGFLFYNVSTPEHKHQWTRVQLVFHSLAHFISFLLELCAKSLFLFPGGGRSQALSSLDCQLPLRAWMWTPGWPKCPPIPRH